MNPFNRHQLLLLTLILTWEVICSQSSTKPSPVTGLNAVKTTTNSLTIEWIKPNDTRAVNYTYRITVTNVMDNVIWINYTKKGETNFTLTGLNPGVQYRLSVQSETPESTLSSPERVIITTNPSPVTGLSMVTRTTNSLTIQWTKPTDTRASCYTYKVIVTTLTNAPIDNGTTNKSETTFTATGLHPGDQYKLSVRSVTLNNTQSSAEEVTGTTNPLPVTRLSVVNRTTNSLTIVWTKPTDTRASDYTYKITVSNVMNNNSQINNTKIDETMFTVTGLDPGDQYDLSVQSVTPEDTLSSPEEVINTTVPDTISNFRCTGSTGYTIGVEWNEPKGKFTSFKAITYIGDRLLINRTIGKDENALRVVNLQPGRKYTIEITTVSGQTYSKQEIKECWTSSEPIIIGATVGPLLGLILIGVLLFFYRVRFRRMNRESEFLSTIALSSAYKPIPVSEYKSYVLCNKNIGFSSEYRDKCEEYWPKDNDTDIYGDFTVNVISLSRCPTWTIRELNIKKAGSSESRRVTQFQFTCWSNQSIPKTTENLLQFHGMIRNYLNKGQGGVPVVHCSSGSGRTGTFIALDYILQQVEKEAVVDVHGVISKIRMNRSSMVQSEALYTFLHQCILDIIERKWNIEHTYPNDTGHFYESIKDKSEYQVVV
ncbi:receptor-type tyrosine-protein phosphatase H-like isoform X2 [Mobula hypostoma]|uniref:receptor-type tyrosine-protein phosphatase H-like isoform X2 n=1 Tax=Mobula hypostoma TaxID=723540 RepID=UPI002FC2FDE2